MQASSLDEALVALRTQARVDVVYAQRLVQDRRTTCRYEGNDPRAALDCLLRGTGLQALPVRYRQYVLVATSGGAGPEGAAPAAVSPRGVMSGFVTDAETGEVLSGAHIYLSELRLGTVTNDAGYFALPALPLRSYPVRFSYLGYAALDTVLSAASLVTNVRLRPQAFESRGVLVESMRNKQLDLSAVPGLLAVPVQQLERMPSFPGEQDLFQALQWLPGVRQSGEVNGGLIVRGGEPDQNLYLLDGAPVYHPWHAFSLISTFQTETFKDIKLYRGSFPAEYGGRLSAVLDAQMKDGNRSGRNVIAALSPLSGRFMVESPISDQASFMISGRRSYLDMLIGRKHPVQADDGRRDTLRTGYYYYDVSAKVTLRPSRRQSLSLTYYRGRDNLDLRLPFDVSLDFSSWRNRLPDLFFEIKHDWGNRLVSARYQYLFSRRLFLTTTAYYSGYQAFEGAFIQPTSNATLDSDYSVDLRDFGLKIDVDYYHTLTHQVRVGAHVVDHRFRSRLDATVARSAAAVDSLSQNSRLESLELVGYVQDAWRPTPRWHVQPGLRFSFFGSGSYARLSPRLSVTYALLPERLLLRGSAGMQVQYMHRLRDRYAFTYDLISSRWIPAQASVRPSSSLQVAAGAESSLLPWLSLAIETYWSASENVLLPEDQYQTKDGLGGPGIELGALLGQYTPALARTFGVELSARLERGPLQVWLNYAGGRSLNRAPALGEGGYRPARFDVPRTFRGVVSYLGQHWSFAVSSELRSGYPHTVPVARYAIGDPLDDPDVYLHRPQFNNGRLPPYSRLDLSLGYRFRLLGASWRSQFHLYNATNHRNVTGLQYDPGQPIVRPKQQRGLPLLPLLEFEVQF